MPDKHDHRSQVPELPTLLVYTAPPDTPTADSVKLLASYAAGTDLPSVARG
ncbi:hypothetical protein [Antrihabitans stalactiti]|uniref:hypothetical protein n=1 Tax=Antrihabitans stalactiti TaxID=2584121 RepID=UPI0019808C90|nr:hypothetical protein [Antrihabitans stalactiti]